MVASIALIGVGLPLGVTALVDAVDDPGDGSEVLARSQELLEAVEARDGDAITAMLADDHDLMAPNESHARQPRATDLLVGDAAAAEAIDLELSWTPPEIDRSAEGEPLTSSTAMVATTVTYGFTVAGERSEASYRVRLAWFRDGALARATGACTTWSRPTSTPSSPPTRRRRSRAPSRTPGRPRSGSATATRAGSRSRRRSTSTPSPGRRSASPTAWCPTPSTRASATSSPSRPPSARSSSRCCRPSSPRSTWSDHLPLSEWLVGLDGAEYVVVVVGAQDGTGRVVAAVPTS